MHHQTLPLLQVITLFFPRTKKNPSRTRNRSFAPNALDRLHTHLSGTVDSRPRSLHGPIPLLSSVASPFVAFQRVTTRSSVCFDRLRGGRGGRRMFNVSSQVYISECRFSKPKFRPCPLWVEAPPPEQARHPSSLLFCTRKGKLGTMPMHAQRAGSSLSSLGRNALSSTWRASPGSSSSSAPARQGVVAAAGGGNRYFAGGVVRSACLRAPVTPDFNTSVNVHEHTISLREKRTARIKEMGERTKGSLVLPKPQTPQILCPLPSTLNPITDTRDPKS
jgi:hypothetical protein